LEIGDIRIGDFDHPDPTPGDWITGNWGSKGDDRAILGVTDAAMGSIHGIGEIYPKINAGGRAHDVVARDNHDQGVIKQLTVLGGQDGDGGGVSHDVPQGRDLSDVSSWFFTAAA